MCYNKSIGQQKENNVDKNEILTLAADLGLASIEREGNITIIGDIDFITFIQTDKSYYILEETQWQI